MFVVLLSVKYRDLYGGFSLCFFNRMCRQILCEILKSAYHFLYVKFPFDILCKKYILTHHKNSFIMEIVFEENNGDSL